MDIEHLQIEANGQRFYVAAAGPRDGAPAMLLHGFPETSYGWRHQLHALAAAGLRVMAPDQRGYGHSAKPAGVAAYTVDTLAADAVAIACALGHDAVRLVGHDWGGVLAWHLATDHAPFVQRAAILNAPHPATLLGYLAAHPTQALRSGYVGFFQLPWLAEAALRADDHALLERALVASSHPDTFSAQELEVYRTAWASEGALTGMLNWYRALPLAPSLGERTVAVPVRILWGDGDAALEPGLADRALARCEHGEVFHLPDATHWLHHERSERVNALLLDFLL